MQETWKKIDGFPNYSVSDLGRVRNDTTGRILIGGFNRGYKNLVLCNNGKRKTFPVHRLVALAFVDNPTGKKTVNHIDNDKTNNSANNLEWVSIEENIKLSWKTGDSVERRKRISQARTGQKWSEEQKNRMSKQRKGQKKPDSFRKKIAEIKKKKVVRMEDGFVFNSITEAAAANGIHYSHISKVCHGVIEKAGGYHWKFKEV